MHTAEDRGEDQPLQQTQPLESARLHNLPRCATLTVLGKCLHILAYARLGTVQLTPSYRV